MSETCLLTVSEAAERLNVRPSFVRRLVFEKRLAIIKIGRLVRIDDRDLADFIKAGRQGIRLPDGA